MTRQSVSKHLDVLEAADLVTTLRRGREKLHFLNAAPISDIAGRWIHHYDRTRVKALADLKTALEATPMDQKSTQTTFVYTTYIHATPERVWQGLTDPAFTKRYWGGVSFPSDWKKGSTYDVAYEGAGLVSATRTGRSSSRTPTAGSPTPGTPSPRSGRLTTASTTPAWPAGEPSPAPRWPSTSRMPAWAW